MQNRYVADVGDFAKYALLRSLCGSPKEPPVLLGVVWCLFPNEGHNNDGRHVSYLDAANFQGLDNALITALRAIIERGQRDISSVISGSILPPGTISYHEPVSPEARCSRKDRISWRSAWINRCLELTANCELVFFDPDNGLEVGSVPKDHPKAGKYVYWDELIPFWRRGQTLLIYHHLNRTAPAARQVHMLNLHFATAFEHAQIVPLVFRRGSSRVFCLVHRGDDIGWELERRAFCLLNTGWSRHFRPFGWPSNDQAGTLSV